MPAEFENPFRTAPGSDPPHLVGRDAEISLARFAIGMTRSGAPAAPVIIMGQRGTGKTALLRRIVAQARRESAIVVATEATRREPFAAILRLGLEAARDGLGSVPEKLKRTIGKVARALPKPEYELPQGAGSITLADHTSLEGAALITLLRELNEVAWKHHKYLLFAVDELQEAQLDDLSALVRFIHETAGTSEPALLIGAGLPNSRDHLHRAHTYTERWRFVEIGLLDRQQTRDAIGKPIRDAGHRIRETALEALAEETAGYPFFIQEYASAAWMHHRNTTITEGDVEAIVPGVRNLLDSSLYNGHFRALTPRECGYVLALSDLGAGSHTVREIAESLGSTSERLSSIRNRLIKKDVLFVPSVGMVEFRIPLTDRYVRRHRTELERRAAKTGTAGAPSV